MLGSRNVSRVGLLRVGVASEMKMFNYHKLGSGQIIVLRTGKTSLLFVRCKDNSKCTLNQKQKVQEEPSLSSSICGKGIQKQNDLLSKLVLFVPFYLHYLHFEPEIAICVSLLYIEMCLPFVTDPQINDTHTTVVHKGQWSWYNFILMLPLPLVMPANTLKLIPILAHFFYI